MQINNPNPIAGANVIYIFQGATLLGLFYLETFKFINMNKTLFLTAVIIVAVVASWCFNQWPLETLVVLLVLALIGFTIEAIYTPTSTIESEMSDNWIDVELSLEDTSYDDFNHDSSMPDSLRDKLIALKNELSEADYWDGDETDKNPN